MTPPPPPPQEHHSIYYSHSNIFPHFTDYVDDMISSYFRTKSTSCQHLIAHILPLDIMTSTGQSVTIEHLGTGACVVGRYIDYFDAGVV